MKKKARIILLIAVVLCMLFVMTACEYGTPDKLGIGDKTFGERMLIGLQVAFLGIGMVFIVLFLLILFVSLIKLVALIGKKKAEKQQAIPAPAPTPALESQAGGDPQEDIAAIMAALTAYYDAQNAQYPTSNLKFKVRSIKKIK